MASEQMRATDGLVTGAPEDVDARTPSSAVMQLGIVVGGLGLVMACLGLLKTALRLGYEIGGMLPIEGPAWWWMPLSFIPMAFGTALISRERMRSDQAASRPQG